MFVLCHHAVAGPTSRLMHWDFSLICEGQAVQCHKMVLSGASPVSKARVENGFKESNENGADLQCPHEVGQGLVTLLYTNELEEEIFDADVDCVV